MRTGHSNAIWLLTLLGVVSTDLGSVTSALAQPKSAADTITATVPAETRPVFLAALQRRWGWFAYAKGPGSDFWRYPVTDPNVQKALAYKKQLMAGSADMRESATQYYAQFTDGGRVFFERRLRTDYGTKYVVDWSRLNYRERTVPFTSTTASGVTSFGTLHISPDGYILSFTEPKSDYVHSFIDTSLLF